MNQKLETLNPNEVLCVQTQLENATTFVERFSAPPLTLTALDHAFATWLASDPPPADINGIINCVGIAFGRSWWIRSDCNGLSQLTSTGRKSPSTAYPVAETSWSILQMSSRRDGSAAKLIS